ncbi:MAG: hypothetical protein QG662_2457 [Pseudomonadota bacterium]|nr:hypothetical protein [Pseudomonadota bacterium]
MNFYAIQLPVLAFTAASQPVCPYGLFHDIPWQRRGGRVRIPDARPGDGKAC